MGKQQRDGRMSKRSERPKRQLELGYYRIITDTDETEFHYFNGMKESLPPQYKGKIEIVVEKKTATNKLLKRALENLGTYSDVWIVLDRDLVPDFDCIIEQAHQNSINIAWSNPCIEIWLIAYFKKMPSVQTSTQCCDAFEQEFKKKTGQEYNKNDERIYQKLIRYGDEAQALERAKSRYLQWTEDAECDKQIRPSTMCPCTMLFELVGDIRSKIQ